MRKLRLTSSVDSRVLLRSLRDDICEKLKDNAPTDLVANCNFKVAIFTSAVAYLEKIAYHLGFEVGEDMLANSESCSFV
jgi:hypothetical protein